MEAGMTDFPAELLARLRACDTPTVCNAIEVAQGRRGFSGFTRATMHWAGSPEARIVGFARTAHIAGRLPPEDPADVLRARRLAYFRSMSEGPRPGVAVVEGAERVEHPVAPRCRPARSATMPGLNCGSDRTQATPLSATRPWISAIRAGLGSVASLRARSHPRRGMSKLFRNTGRRRGRR
jgi:hypothetical protein